ncbi:MAG: S-layer protein, partial [Dialister sp.]|nr:S-layer protein [Dialister sp.]
GERNMTRYELAQIIARLMAREDQMNAEQRAVIDKLAGEYADELANLGVRVTNLEKKVGNISWYGDARMRWQQKGYNADGSRMEDSWNGRLRINAKARVNDSTYVRGRFRGDFNFKDNKDANTYMDLLYVHHQFGDNVGVNLGRSALWLGQTGLVMDDFMDGAQAFIGNEKLMLEAGYGRVMEWKQDGVFTEKVSGKDVAIDHEMAYARLFGNAGRFGYDVEYLTVDKDMGTYIGAGLTAGITEDLDLFGDFYKNTDAEGDPIIWTAGIGFGHAKKSKPGSFRLSAQYVKGEAGAYMGYSSTYTAFPLNSIKSTDAHFWLINGDVALAKNLILHGEYAFDVNADNNVDYDDMATLSLNYSF